MAKNSFKILRLQLFMMPPNKFKLHKIGGTQSIILAKPIGSQEQAIFPLLSMEPLVVMPTPLRCKDQCQLRVFKGIIRWVNKVTSILETLELNMSLATKKSIKKLPKKTEGLHQWRKIKESET